MEGGTPQEGGTEGEWGEWYGRVSKGTCRNVS